MNRQLFKYHPIIGYTFIPQLKTRIHNHEGGYLIRTNNLGFRSELDFVPEKKAGKKRILLFGDSFTAGDSVSNKKRYSDVLSNLINDVEIFNWGMSGTGTDQQYLIFQEFVKEIDYDLLVLAVQVENIRRINSHFRYYKDDQGQTVCYEKPFYKINNETLELCQVPVSKQTVKLEDLSKEEQGKVDKGGRFLGLRTAVTKIGLKDITQKFTKYQPVPEYDNSKKIEWKLMRYIIKEWASKVDKPILLMPLPLYHFTEELSNPKNYQKRFQELATELSISLHDPLPYFKENYSLEERKRFRFNTDIHPTPLGHEAIAKSMVEPVQQILKQY